MRPVYTTLPSHNGLIFQMSLTKPGLPTESPRRPISLSALDLLAPTSVRDLWECGLRGRGARRGRAPLWVNAAPSFNEISYDLSC